MTFLRLVAAALLWLGSIAPALAEPDTVYKTPTCDCCSKWVAHMAENGIALNTVDVTRSELNRLKARLGLKPEQASCHTAMVSGYVVEGHVPAEDVKRLLVERPDAIGLSVPRMPIGSPGMEVGDTKESYDVLLVRKDGSTEVFARR